MQKRNKVYLDELMAKATKAELKFKEVLDELKEIRVRVKKNKLLTLKQ
jgi:hypothetical protein